MRAISKNVKHLTFVIPHTLVPVKTLECYTCLQ